MEDNLEMMNTSEVSSSTYTLSAYSHSLISPNKVDSLLGNYHVVIPIIQRDYAQGRQNHIVRQIRNKFLDKLFYSLKNGISLDMDFVYGTTKNKTLVSPPIFYPLDGQQRLTTLFLLQWYLSMLSHKYNLFHSKFYDKAYKLPKFRYETRKSSTKFCEEIIIQNIENKVASLTSDEKVSSLLHNQSWYKHSWKHDPTTEGMLFMLDSIHEFFWKFKPSGQTSRDFANELLRNLECLTFQVLFMNNKFFTLGDDLYIKMNSRGKPLTDFETFKAKFCQLIKGLRMGWPSRASVFSQKLDHEWIDCFWTNFRQTGQDNVDQQLMNIVKHTIASEYAAREKSNIVLDILFETDKAKDSGLDMQMTFYRYHELGILDNKAASFDYLITRNVIKNFNLITLLCDTSICHYFEPAIKNEIIGNFPLNNNWKPLLIDNNGYSPMTFAERLYLYTFFNFINLSRCNSNNLVDELKAGNNRAIQLLQRWTRFTRNMIESHKFENLDEASNAFHFFALILRQMKANRIYDIIELLAKVYLPPLPQLAGYNEQIQEEILKAKIVYEGKLNWESLFHDIEDDNYLAGRIGFLLIMSDLQKNIFTGVANAGLNYENSRYGTFQKYKTDSFALLKALQGLSRTSGNLSSHSFLLEKALLTKRLYGRCIANTYDGRTLSLSNFYNENNSWRSIAAYTPSTTVFSDALKAIYDDSAFNCNDVVNSLKSIINNYKYVVTKHWWSLLIENPEILKECHDSCIWIDDRTPGKEKLFLLSKSRLSSYHTELYTRVIYNDIILTSACPGVHVEYLSSTTNPNDIIPGIYVKFHDVSRLDVTYYLYIKSQSFLDYELSIVRADDLKQITDATERANLASVYPGSNSYLVETISKGDITKYINDFANKISKQTQYTT